MLDFSQQLTNSLGFFRISTQDRDVILCIANFQERKGHELLMEAFARVSHRVPNAVVVHIGRSSAYLKYLERQRIQLSLEDRAFFVQERATDLVPHYLSQAAVFVLASRSEGFPLVLVEAGAAGIPVIATKASGVDEIITDGVTGRLVEIDDVGGLGEAIVELLSCRALARRFATNLQSHVQRNLTWDNQYRKYREVYLSKPTQGVG